MSIISNISETFACSLHANENILVDSLGSCIFYQLPNVFNLVYFQYLTVAIIIPIVLISLLSSIKESYRWFILNQAIWDLFLIFDVICTGKEFSTCDYVPGEKTLFKKLLFFTIKNAANCALYGPMVLLTLSRFVCMYFPHFYRHYATPKKIIVGIIIVQVAFLALLSSFDWYQTITAHFQDQKLENCGNEFCTAIDKDPEEMECNLTLYLPCLEDIHWETPAWQNFLYSVEIFIKPLMLLLADILALSVISIVLKHLCYQAQLNSSHLRSSLRIAAVMLAQCAILTLLSILSLAAVYNQEIFLYTRILLPRWFVYLSRPYSLQWLSVFRAFCDSFIVLTVLKEYRAKLISIFKAYLNL